MSTFVEIAPDEYDPTAFKGFRPSAAGFEMANARALMWFSQLAYETHRTPTIEAVSGVWEFTSVVSFIKHKTSLKGSFETCGLIGERAGAVIMAFAGTDPGIWQNLATDFTPLPQAGSDIHEGFRLAAAAAQSEIEQAVRLSRQSQKPLFIIGHSLGAALAALAAQVALEKGLSPSAVYTFGMRRVGGERSEASYDAGLGVLTYRLVHGIDLVARATIVRRVSPCWPRASMQRRSEIRQGEAAVADQVRRSAIRQAAPQHVPLSGKLKAAKSAGETIGKL